jgi:hypothetical protein
MLRGYYEARGLDENGFATGGRLRELDLSSVQLANAIPPPLT